MKAIPAYASADTHNKEEPKAGIIPRALGSCLMSWSSLQTVVLALQRPIASAYDRSTYGMRKKRWVNEKKETSQG